MGLECCLVVAPTTASSESLGASLGDTSFSCQTQLGELLNHSFWGDVMSLRSNAPRLSERLLDWPYHRGPINRCVIEFDRMKGIRHFISIFWGRYLGAEGQCYTVC